MNRSICTLGALAATALFAVSPAAAGGWGFKLMAATTYVAPLSENQQNVGGVASAVRASNEMGYQFGAEFRTGFIGIAFDYLHARQDIEHANAGLLGAADFNPISATLFLHVPTPVIELYVGPTASYVNWGDLDLSTGGTQKLDAKYGYGISVGGDLAIARAVAVVGGLRWLKLDAEPKGGNTIAVDPLISHIGFALRF